MIFIYLYAIVDKGMKLEKLTLLNYKNIQQAELEFGPKINCFIGDNGVGKTNLIDSIYYLSFCKSYFNTIDTYNIRHAEPFMVLQGDYERQGEDEKIYCGIKRGKKKHFKRNKKEYSKLSDHIGLLPVVMVSPSDNRLILEGSEERRRYLDGVISQFDHMYLESLIAYNRLLNQRNALLKSLTPRQDTNLVQVLNDQMVPLAVKIYSKRREFIDKLVPVFQKYHNILSLHRESVGLEYRSDMSTDDYSMQLALSLQKDLSLGYTSKGVHRDDLVFKLDEYPIKRVGSQGQQKTFLMALKFAQFDFIHQMCEFSPLLLLDDIFDKLDAERVEQIVRLVSEERFGQIFITDTNREHLYGILKKLDGEHRIFQVKGGEEIKLIS